MMQIFRAAALLIVAAGLVGCAANGGEKSQLHFVEGDGYRDLVHGEKPVYRSMIAYDPAKLAETYKPFIHVFGMHDEGFITKGAGGLDTHHRGIFLGFNTQYGNFWSCGAGVSQKHVSFLTDREFVKGNTAREVEVNDWLDKDGKAVVRDTREVTTKIVGDDEIVMDFDITIESLGGDVQLGGDPHHGGFHFRAAQEVAGDATNSSGGSATYIRPASAKLIKNDTWSDESWAAMSFPIKGNFYTVLHMNAPQNPGPTTYSTRPYGRFGSFFTTTLSETKPLKLKYRLIVLDGKTHANLTVEELQKRYDAFAGGKR